MNLTPEETSKTEHRSESEKNTPKVNDTILASRVSKSDILHTLEETQLSMASENNPKIDPILGTETSKEQKSPSATPFRRKSTDSQPDRSSYSSALSTNTKSGSLDGGLSPKESLSEFNPKLKTVDSILNYQSFLRESQTEQISDVVNVKLSQTEPNINLNSTSLEHRSSERSETIVLDSRKVETETENNVTADNLEKMSNSDALKKSKGNINVTETERTPSGVLDCDRDILANSLTRSYETQEERCDSESEKNSRQASEACSGSCLAGERLENLNSDQQPVKEVCNHGKSTEFGGMRDESCTEGICDKSMTNEELDEKIQGTELKNSDLVNVKMNDQTLEHAHNEKAQLENSSFEVSPNKFQIGTDSLIKDGEVGTFTNGEPSLQKSDFSFEEETFLMAPENKPAENPPLKTDDSKTTAPNDCNTLSSLTKERNSQKIGCTGREDTSIFNQKLAKPGDSPQIFLSSENSLQTIQSGLEVNVKKSQVQLASEVHRKDDISLNPELNQQPTTGLQDNLGNKQTVNGSHFDPNTEMQDSNLYRNSVCYNASNSTGPLPFTSRNEMHCNSPEERNGTNPADSVLDSKFDYEGDYIKSLRFNGLKTTKFEHSPIECNQGEFSVQTQESNPNCSQEAVNSDDKPTSIINPNNSWNIGLCDETLNQHISPLTDDISDSCNTPSGSFSPNLNTNSKETTRDNLPHPQYFSAMKTSQNFIRTPKGEDSSEDKKVTSEGRNEEGLLKNETLNDDDLEKIWNFVEINLSKAKQLYDIIQPEERSAKPTTGLLTSQTNLQPTCAPDVHKSRYDHRKIAVKMDERRSQRNESNNCLKVVKFKEATVLQKPLTQNTELAISEVQSPEFKSDLDQTGANCKVLPPEKSLPLNKIPSSDPGSSSQDFVYSNVKAVPSAQPLDRNTRTQNICDQGKLEHSEPFIVKEDLISSRDTSKRTFFGPTSFVVGTEIPKGLVEDTRKFIEGKSEMARKHSQKLSKDSAGSLKERVHIKSSRDRYEQMIQPTENTFAKTDKQRKGDSGPSVQASILPTFQPKKETTSCDVKDSCFKANLNINNQGNFSETDTPKVNQVMKSSTTHRLVGGLQGVETNTASSGFLSTDISVLNAAASEQGEHFISILVTPEKTPSSSTTSHVEQKIMKNSENLWRRRRDEQQKKEDYPVLLHYDPVDHSGNNTSSNVLGKSLSGNSGNTSKSSFSRHYLEENVTARFAAKRSYEMVFTSKESPTLSTVEDNLVNTDEPREPKRKAQNLNIATSSSLKCNSRASFYSVCSKNSFKSEPDCDEYRDTLSKNDLLNNDFPAPNEILKAIATNRTMVTREANAPSSRGGGLREQLMVKTADTRCSRSEAEYVLASQNSKTDSSTFLTKTPAPQGNVNVILNNLNQSENRRLVSDLNRKGVTPGSSRIAVNASCSHIVRGDEKQEESETTSNSDEQGKHGLGVDKQTTQKRCEEEVDNTTKVEAVSSKHSEQDGKPEYLILCQYYSLVQSSEPEGKVKENECTEPLEAQVHVRLSPAITNLISHPNLPTGSLMSSVETVTITSHVSLPRWSRLNLIATCVEFCRICHDTAGAEDFISPCDCRGTLSKVHKFCLEKWLAESDTSVCELCGHKFKIVRVPRYSVMNSILRWFNSQENVRNVRELFFDMVTLCAFTPVIIGGSYFGLLVAETVYQRMVSSTISRAASFTLVSMMTTMDLAFLSWFAIRTQYHTMQWYGWWRRNCDVKIVLPEQNQVKDKNTRCKDPKR